jgi:hypothetical protein
MKREKQKGEERSFGASGTEVQSIEFPVCVGTGGVWSKDEIESRNLGRMKHRHTDTPGHRGAGETERGGFQFVKREMNNG